MAKARHFHAADQSLGYKLPNGMLREICRCGAQRARWPESARAGWTEPRCALCGFDHRPSAACRGPLRQRG